MDGKDWYVGFGEDEARSWEDARAYEFVSAGGGPWYSRTLKKLPVDGRVFVNLPGRGYVGVGVVTGHAVPAREFKVTHDGQELRLSTLRITHPGLNNAQLWRMTKPSGSSRSDG